MSLTLCFLVCDYLYPEMKAAVQAERLTEVEVKPFPARCGRPPVQWQEVAASINGSGADKVELFGCYCLQDLKTVPPEFSHCRIIRQEQCFHLMCGSVLTDALQQGGAYLMTPGWLAHWQQHVADWGFDRETAAEFFGQSLSRLLLLDTGVDEKASKNLEEFSSFLNLPAEALSIGLDFHRLALVKRVSGYRQYELERQLRRALRHSADSAMALDMLGRVTRAGSEAEVIDAIVELFTMLLAPEKVIYARVRKTGMLFDQIVDLTADEQRSLEAFHEQSKKQYQLNESGDGFLLRMGRGAKVTAILFVQRVAFPQYIEHYLNVAIRVAGVCALAVELARTVEKLLDTSRLAGKAEVATEVLHNVGNTLNSISVSSEQISEMAQKSSCRTLPAIVDLIEKNSGHLGDFFDNDPRGSKLPLYFSKLSELLIAEQEELIYEIRRQFNHIGMVAEIIRAQQNSAKGVGLKGQVDLADLVEGGLQIFEQQIRRKQVQIEREYGRLLVIHGERHKILQVVNNLVSNALDAFDGMEMENRKIILRLYPADDQAVVLEVEDNGMGISSSIMEQIFVFGFTTKKDGHGFGLHNAVNLSREMGGTLTAESPGKEKGTIFRLRLPTKS